MARRSPDWNEGLAQELRDPEFAREFLLAAMEEGLPVQVRPRPRRRNVGFGLLALQASGNLPAFSTMRRYGLWRPSRSAISTTT